MDQLGEIFQRRTTSGEPLTIGDVTITPQSRVLVIRWPYGGFVWNRPVSVLVERDGHTEQVPIVDLTRAAQLRLLGFGLVLSIAIIVLSALSRRDQHG
ncbi:MAG: hypothetical protein MAG451_00577 [Anaerolineales bacterium]|nr:hypothetical protein [Anaerolineales bacterium]